MEWAQSKGLMPFVPVRFGGLGLPGRTGREKTLKHLDSTLRRGITRLALRPPKNIDLIKPKGLWSASCLNPSRSAAHRQAHGELFTILNRKNRRLLLIKREKFIPPGYSEYLDQTSGEFIEE